MSEKQKTIKKKISLTGVGLHTGEEVTIRFKPAEIDTGIMFSRVDLSGSPAIEANFSNILENAIPRCTSIGKDAIHVHTIEHVMSVLCGLRIDNIRIEINGSEVPGLDGSGVNFLKALKEAGIVEQEEDRRYFDIKEPIWIEQNGAILLALPSNEFRISYLLDYSNFGVNTQFLSINIEPESFEEEIAPCRTFCLEGEAEELQKSGLGKGATYDNTLVITDGGVKNNKIRFKDEFARHKILDFIGDIYLLGMPIRAHIFAVKSGHNLNFSLLRKIVEQRQKYQIKVQIDLSSFDESQEIDISGIMKILPHRYPFLLVDRIVELEKGKRAVGIKNVTINDNFFEGHFPTRPIMPGVLMVEAMAQVAGVTILTDEQHKGKLALFMAADNVKFRKVVVPGDQLLMEIEVTRNRAKTAQAKAQAKVNGEVVAETELMFSFMDSTFLG